MIDWIKYRWKLSRALREIRNLQGLYDKDRKKLDPKDKNALENLAYSERSEYDLVHDEIAVLQTRYYCRIATARSIPLPERNAANWEESLLLGGNNLTTVGLHSLRSAIRREWKEGLDTWAPLASLAIAIGALLVAASSLLVNMHKH